MFRLLPRIAVLTTACVVMHATAASATDLKVVVTIKPIHALATAVMRGVGEPKLLIDGSGSPHTFTLKPSDAKALNAANVFFRVSEGLEPFTGRLVKALPKSVTVVTLETALGLTLHPLRTGDTFEAHDHAAEAKKGGHNHGHQHHRPQPKQAGTATENDGHIWLDPANAKVIAGAIAKALATAAPDKAATFEANAAELGRQLDQLDAELVAALKPLAGKPYIVFHDAYQYLERRYGLEPVGSVTVSPDVPPSAKRLTELRRKVSGLKAACVFAEPQFQPRIIDTIVEGTTARRGTLDPLGAAIPAGADHYASLMRTMAADLKACLANPA